MAASAKTVSIPDQSNSGDWTVVLPRRGKQKKTFPKLRIREDQRTWSPTDQANDTIRESKLLQKMEICIKKLENSQFYQTLVEELETMPFLESLNRVLGSESKMGMVVYGVGSIENYENPRLQLSLAILLKRKFSWIESLEVFDPILSATECRLMESFGCSVLSFNEQGRRCAEKPTMFFMPHCEAELYNNLLQENWKVGLLNHIVLFGNSFEIYEQFVSEFKNSPVVDSSKFILASRKFIREIKIKTVSDDYFGAFHDSSWQFFSPVSPLELQFIDL
ncbi:protein SENSITIVITY TO RED LIGHT REDUCED 1 [Cucumis sativus]|nr:protein SENSITIVITY TO RED LIGHT REDUCED 1 [Cucumis sativus]XP_031741082.1 protein SENSITIVITY TO RED LIGHT REDUCED 1 [Cucumis sativus]XP_031741084.1 protein SENSITIVITY TO RED LIGHT REDUCED 1 [Cucumis sativus]XP_031741085.1 protein SENSITIVITY TO RED LIGHT REDUCED 1 [Cucumis sativus]XP_031741086.1 protein SENSITIVITY TO RED LIGHT REDUCED 1 [Cucumis sativus]XP_031741087.1 protein SENSITIVITY TO RED LIGHT REDUCED 1 [Cucumis sativus]XP_031741088.1 protein SENSITIVITY TO RED LIGHT REDUCED 1 [